MAEVARHLTQIIKVADDIARVTVRACECRRGHDALIAGSADVAAEVHIDVIDGRYAHLFQHARRVPGKNFAQYLHRRVNAQLIPFYVALVVAVFKGGSRCAVEYADAEGLPDLLCHPPVFRRDQADARIRRVKRRIDWGSRVIPQPD
ncbi:hypothetical protein SDC9_209701 [bioreactor metagenome]|uniref:Uncharacterized protein n=1 Tax=bioreactor metagenome TaxID=1076179 RepID=A0A645JDZ9_9ZZZZ